MSDPLKSRFVTDAKVDDVSRRANTFARRFNTIAEQHGFDLPMEVLIPLIELFGEAMQPASPEDQS